MEYQDADIDGHNGSDAPVFVVALLLLQPKTGMLFQCSKLYKGADENQGIWH